MDSNGYIMLDFSMLDFSRHNQIIEGIYKRVFEIVGINKFVIILGADNKTPLPACVSFTNGSYVIESFLFNFVITIDDNVRIENVSADIIKDGIISAGTTWSSEKINSLIGSSVSFNFDDISGSYNGYTMYDVKTYNVVKGKYIFFMNYYIDSETNWNAKAYIKVNNVLRAFMPSSYRATNIGGDTIRKGTGGLIFCCTDFSDENNEVIINYIADGTVNLKGQAGYIKFG